MYMSSDIDRLLFQLLRSMQLLLDYFGLEDKATMIQGDFACVSTSNYPYVYLRGDYMDCLYAASRHPGSRVLPASEVEIIEQIYRFLHAYVISLNRNSNYLSIDESVDSPCS